ncbi:hypothetical protein MMPV_006586 [Pyropia vietnamensis]
MGIVAELPRSSALAWAPSGTGAMLAAAPAADIFDASFDAGGRLELLALDVHAPALRLRAAAPCPERAHAVAWGAPSTSPGLVAAALEGGAVSVWDASALLRLPLASSGGPDGGGAAAAATVVSAGTGAHAGAARAVEWNPRVPTLLASAGDDGHVLVWDFGRGAGSGAAVSPLTPVGVAPAPPGASGADAPAGAAPAKEAMLSVAWNRQMQQILAGGGAAGVTAVWDLRQKRRVIALRNPRGRLTCSGLAWSPTVATQLLTASAERGALLWDLRNATAPLRSLRHHRAGIAAVSWCPQDSGLLLTAGHDGATLVVDPASGDVLSSVSHVGGSAGEASGAGPGADGGDTDSLDGGVVRGDFGLGWNPRLPGVFATASRDGRIAVQSLLTASVASSVSSATASALSTAFGGEFVSGATAESPRVTAAASPGNTLMSRSPAWLARRACLSFGPCGRPVTVVSGGAAGAKGTSPTSIVRLHPRVQAEETFVSAALALERDVGGPEADLASLAAYCDEKAENVGEDGGDDGPVERVSWALLALQLRPHARQQLLSHLGFSVPAASQSSSDEIVGLEASPPLCSMKGDAPETAAAPLSPPPGMQDTSSYALQSPVSGMPLSPGPYTDTLHGAANLDGPAPWDMPDSVGAAPPTVSGLGSILDGDPSGSAQDESSGVVFGDGGGAANGGDQTPSGDAQRLGGDNGNADVLTAANVDVEDAAAVDRFVSRSVLVGDFSAAVDASLRTGRFADALLLARRGGDDLWQRAADAVMSTSPPPAPTAALAAAAAAVAGRVSLERAADWRDALAAAVTFSGGPELSASARAIAVQIMKGKDDSLTGDAAAEAAITCYIAAGDTAAAAKVWLSSLTATRSASRLPELTAAVAKIRLLAAAVCAGRGDTTDLGSVRALDATSASALVAFGRTLAAAGQPGLAVAYFANIESAADDADLARNASYAYAPQPTTVQSQEQYGQSQQSAYGQPQQQPQGFGHPSQQGFSQQQQPGTGGYGPTAGGYPPASPYPGSSYAPAPAAGGFGTPVNGFGNGPPQGGAGSGGAGFYGAQQQSSAPVPASSPAFQPPQPPAIPPVMPPVPAPPQSFGSPSPSGGVQSGPTGWGAPVATPTLPPMPLAPSTAPSQGAPPALASNFGAPFGSGSAPPMPAFQQQQPTYTPPTMPAMPSLPPPMPSFSGGIGGDAGSGGFGGALNAASVPPSMPGAASALPPPPPPPPPPSDPTAMSGGAPFNPNARARSGGDGSRPRLPPSAEVAGVVRKPAGTPGAPGAPTVGMSRSSSASSALGALSVAGSDAAGGGGGGVKLASLPAVAVDAADVSAVPREQAGIPRALCGAFSYTAQLSSTPVFRRKMDDVSRKLGRLLSALNAGILDAAVVAHLLRLAGALEKGDYDEAALVVQVLTREHWDEHGSWIQALQRMIQSARTGR